MAIHSSDVFARQPLPVDVLPANVHPLPSPNSTAALRAQCMHSTSVGASNGEEHVELVWVEHVNSNRCQVEVTALVVASRQVMLSRSDATVHMPYAGTQLDGAFSQVQVRVRSAALQKDSSQSPRLPAPVIIIPGVVGVLSG